MINQLLVGAVVVDVAENVNIIGLIVQIQIE
jgi:hypothetical protein